MLSLLFSGTKIFVAWLLRNTDRVLVFLIPVLVANLLVPEGVWQYVAGFGVLAAILFVYLRTRAGFAFTSKFERIRWAYETRLRAGRQFDYAGLSDKGLQVRQTRAGLIVEAPVEAGRLTSEYEKLAELLKVAFRAYAVRMQWVREYGYVRFLVQEENPLTGAVSLDEEEATSAAEPCKVGVFADGTPAYVATHSQTLLIGGSPGAGKSVFGWKLLLHYADDPSTILIVVDLKPYGVESAPIHARAQQVCTTTSQTHQVFADVWELINRRYQILLERGLEKVPTNEPEEFPLVVIFVDEAAELSRAEDDHGKAALALLTRIVAVGRAAGVTVNLLTQKPDSSVLPTALRDLFAQRVCFRVGNREQAAVVLGSLGEEIKPWTIPTDNPGEGVLLGPNGQQVSFKSAYLTREQIVERGKQAAERRTKYVYELEEAGKDVPVLPTVSISFGQPDKAPVPRSRRSRRASSDD